MEILRNRVPDTTSAVAMLQLQHQPAQSGNGHGTGSPVYLQQYQGQGQQKESTSPMSNLSMAMSGDNQHPQPQNDIRYLRGYLESPSTSYGNRADLVKRNRGDFELIAGAGLDVVSRSLISLKDASVYFRTFFQGCVSFTLFEVEVRERENLTWNRINMFRFLMWHMILLSLSGDGARCCLTRFALLGVELNVVSMSPCSHRLEMTNSQGPGSGQYQSLSNATKSPICDVLLGTVPKSIETVQALLISAGYSEKGWLLTSMAVRMALDLDLPGSYAKLSALSLGSEGEEEREKIEEERLMRESRVWFGTFILENM